MSGRAIWPAELECRQDGPDPAITGRLPLGVLATTSDRGTVRKERIMPRALEWTVRGRGSSREVNLLRGHSYDAPLASRRAGTLELDLADDALNFRARLPVRPAERPSWMNDVIRSIHAGLMRGLSPGFVVPPPTVRPGAVRLVPEPGNTGVMIREIWDLVLFELSIVTRPAYSGTGVGVQGVEPEDLDCRAWDGFYDDEPPQDPGPPTEERLTLWL